ncbi:MAG: TolC family protein [Ignavibacteriales bacterium]|nr:TolC family protein [Ignavibacteriales bacterium]
MREFILVILFLSVQLEIVIAQDGKTSLSLRQAMNEALAYNPEILKTQKEIDAAAARVLQAGRIPNLELSVAYNEISTSLAVGDAGEKDVGLTQPIEFPGKRGSRVDVAEHGKSIAELSLLRTKAIVSAKVKRAYYQSLLAGEVVSNLKFTITLLSDFLRTVTERYQAGASKYLDVIRAKVEVTRLRNDLVEAKREQQTRLGELNVLLGRTGNTPVVLSDSLTYQPLGIPQDSAVEVYANQSNILKIVEREAQRSQSVLNLARTSYLPDFSLGVALQKRPGQISPTGSSGNPSLRDNYLGFQFGASVPLWFWQAPKGEVQEAEALLDMSNIRISAARLRVRLNILSAFRSASVAQEQLQVFDTSLLRDVEDQLRAGISAYQNNQVDALNLFDIYRTFRATKIEYARALYNLLAAKAELEVAGETAE